MLVYVYSVWPLPAVMFKLIFCDYFPSCQAFCYSDNPLYSSLLYEADIL